MQCPVDGTQLVMTERSGVEIDYCPQCRGVWLDRGELDKILDRAAPAAPARPAPERGYEERREGYGGRYEGKPYRKKREGFLGDLFDF
jgi:Zn-finger nucleic acid-binding protein